MCEYVRKADQLGADMKKYKKKSRRRGNLPHIPDEMRVAGTRLFEQLRRASLRAACPADARTKLSKSHKCITPQLLGAIVRRIPEGWLRIYRSAPTGTVR